MRCRTIERDPSLLGADFTAVRARYGAPLRCANRAGVLVFAYPGRDGVIDDAVAVADGVVVRIDPGILPAPATHGVHALLGATVGEVFARFGAPRHVVRRGGACAIEFEHAVVFALEDLVVGVREIAPAGGAAEGHSSMVTSTR